MAPDDRRCPASNNSLLSRSPCFPLLCDLLLEVSKSSFSSVLFRLEDTIVLSGAISGLGVGSNQAKQSPLPPLSSALWLQLVGLSSPGPVGESPPEPSVGLQLQLCSCCVDVLRPGLSLGSFLQEPGATSTSGECDWHWCALSFCNLSSLLSSSCKRLWSSSFSRMSSHCLRYCAPGLSGKEV